MNSRGGLMGGKERGRERESDRPFFQKGVIELLVFNAQIQTEVLSKPFIQTKILP